MKTTGYLFFLVLVANSTIVGAVDLPITTNFNNDVVGLPPAVGGPNQPTALVDGSGTTVTVQASAFGLIDQPVVVESPNDNYVSVNWIFPEVVDGTVRCEATVATDSLINGYFLQTASINDAVGARLVFVGTGQIREQSGVNIGFYVPESPFRVRLDVQPAAEEYCATIDDEMNGFGDDTEYCGLPVLNSGNFYPIGGFYASLHPAVSTQGAVAYDDILVEVVVVGPTIFVDDFESGNASKWSSIVP